eukprot:CAMPEP_0115512598 /NCGR_PEP_ID=MMETSP0271-20121206/74600_1 /TAXON_ID=71861 /ORGANISM="Scrippsiella trochoidea, Strain CCMP3099" /LENGTH=47 /DNA_ID= /DNA_START= /DNA_END= /DNA_ORIENTATION=
MTAKGTAPLLERNAALYASASTLPSPAPAALGLQGGGGCTADRSYRQ